MLSAAWSVFAGSVEINKALGLSVLHSPVETLQSISAPEIEPVFYRLSTQIEALLGRCIIGLHAMGFSYIFTRGWLGRLNSVAGVASKFIDLAPTDKADGAGVYSDALLYATNNPRVSNIALTGPYGSGKSSIIKSFLKTYRKPALQLSLAAFLPEATVAGGEVSKQEIERSILQQMLYGADTKKLPLSRFRRIQTPGRWSVVASLYILVGLFSCWNLFQHHEALINGSYLTPFEVGNWFNITCFAVATSFLWLILHHLYVASFGVSLKSISLKDIEITPKAIDQESILNRHLDEIIYFFQRTNYDLVIIEDLDRFNNSEIFVTLREINGLVNQNSGVHRTIRFLYALRDDMFVNTDRTKFFEFIIPVIPIINSSNSIDKLLEQGRRLLLHDRLERQFLREVSRYLNDLRLIQNIFNEYAVYVANLETDGDNVLDANKLLAILIYKNVFPKDFENLHRGKGNLAKILDQRYGFISGGEAAYKSEISELENDLAALDSQIPFDVQELRRIYAMALIETLPENAFYVSVTGQNLISLNGLAQSESFESIIGARHIFYRTVQGSQSKFDVSSFQAGVNPLKTFAERKDEVERRAADYRNASSKRIAELRAKISTLRMAKFSELIRLNASDGETLFEAFGDNKELARFLVFEGYLDDTYYQYTSLFHSGRLSPSDNKYLIYIRAFANPDPDFPIDNPGEVISAMREDDFSQNYFLNVKIVDYILASPSSYSSHLVKMLRFIEENFRECEEFFTIYYATGAHVSALMSVLVKTWPGFVPAAIATPKNLTHTAQLIAHLPIDVLAELPAIYPHISEFVAVNLPNILALEIEFDPIRLKSIEMEIDKLQSVEAYTSVVHTLFTEGLYNLSIENVEFVYRSLMGFGDLERLRTQHYTTVLKTRNSSLISRIERNFKAYVGDVLLALEDNSRESISAILLIVAHDELEIDDIQAFLEQQTTLIPSLEKAPERLHALLFQIAKVEATWENCIAFLTGDNFDADSLTAYLSSAPILTVLSQQAVPGDGNALLMRQFLIGNDTLQDSAYRAYMQNLPDPFLKFPEEVNSNKLKILIEEGKVTFSDENLSFLPNDSDLQILFVVENILRYLESDSAQSTNDEFREKLLISDIHDDNKLKIIRSMDLTRLAELPKRAGILGPIIDRTGADVSLLDKVSARAIITNSAPVSVQISMLNKCRNILDNDDVREVLAALPEPFSEITTGYHTPRVKKTAENMELVEWLGSRDIISSWKEALFSDEIRVNLFRR